MRLWNPIPSHLAALERRVLDKDCKLILDIGGNNNCRFSLAHQTVGWEGDVRLDLCHDRLPWEGGSVDFVYCRHTIEDLADPTHLLREIRRVAKSGLIETPSPMAETTRAVDAQGDHLGYKHHRWICATVGGVLTCLAKYPFIERLPLDDHWRLLQTDPLAWNNYHEFENPLEFRVVQHLSLIHI